jgi:hypothetical protein
MYSATTALEVPVVEHEDVIAALAAQRTEKTVHRPRSCPARTLLSGLPGCPSRGGDHVEGGPELVVAIADQEPRCSTQGGRVAKLLRYPRLRRKRVVAASTTLRVANSINTNAKIERKNTS